MLRWEAPGSCPNQETVRAQVLRLAALDGRSVHRLEAQGFIETDGRTWSLVLTTRFESTLGERRLSASSCAALTDAAVVVMALILNPESEVKSRPSEPVTSRPPRAHARPLGVRGLLDVRAGVHAGVVSGVGAELGAGAGLALDAASLRLAAIYAPPFDVHLSGGSGPGGRLWFFSVSGVGCWGFGAAVVVGPCAGVAFTRLAGRGIEVAMPHSAVTRWVSASFGLVLGVPLGRVVSLQAGGQMLVPLHRPTLYLEDLGPVARPAVGAEIWAGTEFAFP